MDKSNFINYMIRFIKKLYRNYILHPGMPSCEKCGIPFSYGRPWKMEKDSEFAEPTYYYECDCYEY